MANTNARRRKTLFSGGRRTRSHFESAFGDGTQCCAVLKTPLLPATIFPENSTDRWIVVLPTDKESAKLNSQKHVPERGNI